MNNSDELNQLVIFKDKAIRCTIHKNQWWFVVVDVIEVLIDSSNPSDYIKKMRSRDKELAKGWGQFVTPFSVSTEGGKQRINCANTESLFIVPYVFLKGYIF